MKMQRIVIILMAALMTVGSVWARDEDEVIVTRQLTAGQRNALPEKTIAVEMKRLAPSKKADSSLIDALIQTMDTVANEDYQNRTFVLLLEPKGLGEVGITIQNDDIVSHGSKDGSPYYGAIEHKKRQFVVLVHQGNEPLVERTFKRQGKITFVQEFEFVDFKTPIYPTHVTASWSPATGLSWESVIINEDPLAERNRQDRPIHILDKNQPTKIKQ